MSKVSYTRFWVCVNCVDGRIPFGFPRTIGSRLLSYKTFEEAKDKAVEIRNADFTGQTAVQVVKEDVTSEDVFDLPSPAMLEYTRSREQNDAVANKAITEKMWAIRDGDLVPTEPWWKE